MTFRILSYLIIFISIAQLLPAQEWAPVGTRWYYTQSSFFGDKLHTIEVVDDTLINGKACQVLGGARSCFFEFRFAYREDRRIFYYSKKTAQFELLYDFNLLAGDTLKMFVGIEADPVDTFYLQIDSIGYAYINDDSIQIQFVSPINGRSFGDKIYEDVGGNEYFLPFEGICGPETGPLRCLEHPNLGLYQFITDFSCDYVPILEPEAYISLEVYPNPVSRQLHISAPGKQVDRLKIMEFNGRVVYRKEEMASVESPLEVSNLPDGIYLLEVHFRDGSIALKKFLKQ